MSIGKIITVVIPNWNGMSWLARCLDALAMQDMSDFRTIVVDNGSSDGSVGFIRKTYPGVEIVDLRVKLVAVFLADGAAEQHVLGAVDLRRLAQHGRAAMPHQQVDRSSATLISNHSRAALPNNICVGSSVMAY
jgi:glycosyltransferase involved in cell wall biosynthesis